MFRRPSTAQRGWKLILVSHTHWDREWYLPFQQFRAMLVEAVDSLLEIMTGNPDYRYFTLDGQTIVLEDYLEVRPDREKQIRTLIRDGRILIGPWYVMPDEFLVSGEALIRNLLEGRRTAARFGLTMMVGYIPDPFGHIAQMPQILRGFGIDSAVLWRGIGSELSHNEALWESPDGSQLLLEYLPRGYANAAVLPVATGALMERLAHIRSELEPGATTPYLLLMNGDDHMFPQREIPDIVKTANQRLRDAEVIDGTLPMMIRAVRDSATANGMEWETLRGELRSSERAHLLAGVLSSRITLKQRNFNCQTLLERWAEPFSSFATLLSPTRLPDQASVQDGTARDAPGLLRLAWRYLLANQPHDSICGCSIDQVHQEMQTRFDWCEQIAGPIVERALDTIAASTDSESLISDRAVGGAIVVFNSEAGPRTDYVEAVAQLPIGARDSILVGSNGEIVPHSLLRTRVTELAAGTLTRSQLQGYLRLAGPGKDWPRWKLRIMEKVARAALRGRLPNLVVTTMDVVPGDDPTTVTVEAEVAAGEQHNYDAIAAGLRQLSSLVDRGDARLFHFRVHRQDQVEIGFVATDVPSHGLKLFRFEKTRPSEGSPAHQHEEATLENEYISLQISREDGSVRLIDRETGAIYWGLNSFVDGGDAGDEYSYSPPDDNPIVNVPSEPPTITLEENGPARCRARVDMKLRLPSALREDRRARAAETVDCPLTSWLTVYPGVPRVDVRTVFTNLVRDHRLRVHFPTSLRAAVVHAEGQFAVIRRPVEAARPVPPDWVEHPVTSQPQLTFVDVSDGEYGLLVANRGLPEYDVAPMESGPCIALTLLRCVGWLSRGDLATRHGDAGPSIPTPGAQLPGTHTFEYSIVPHVGTWEQVLHQAHWFARPLRSAWTGLHQGPLGAEASLLSLTPTSLVLSALKLPEDGRQELIVRLFNSTEKAVDGAIHCFFPLESAALANLAEEPGEEIPLLDSRTLHFLVAASRIVTLRLTPARQRPSASPGLSAPLP